MEEKKPMGAVLLKVSSILMIIGAVVLVILTALILAAAFAIDVQDRLFSATGYASMILGSLSYIFELITGIFGLKNCRKPATAKKCILLGAIVIGLNIICRIFGIIGGSDFRISEILVGILVPAMYVIGAVLNKQAE